MEHFITPVDHFLYEEIRLQRCGGRVVLSIGTRDYVLTKEQFEQLRHALVDTGAVQKPSS